jgi:hypothetical protein
LKQAAPLLEQTLREENKKADGLLNQIANGEVNRKAAAAA